jgi:hypothetical protein
VRHATLAEILPEFAGQRFRSEERTLFGRNGAFLGRTKAFFG